MQDDDKLYGLIAQAEDIQKHAITLHKAAQDAIKGLPEGYREAVKASTQETLTEAAQNASTALLSACQEAKATSASLRRTGLMQGFFLVAVALVIAGIGFFTMNYIAESRISELAELKQTIATEQGTLAELRGKTWGLELVNYGDGTRGIILPKGVKADRIGEIKATGQAAIVIKP